MSDNNKKKPRNRLGAVVPPKVEKPVYFIIPQDSVQKIMGYLAGQKWIEANPLMQLFTGLPTYEPQDEEVAPPETEQTEDSAKPDEEPA